MEIQGQCPLPSTITASQLRRHSPIRSSGMGLALQGQPNLGGPGHSPPVAPPSGWCWCCWRIGRCIWCPQGGVALLSLEPDGRKNVTLANATQHCSHLLFPCGPQDASLAWRSQGAADPLKGSEENKDTHRMCLALARLSSFRMCTHVHACVYVHMCVEARAHLSCCSSGT